MADIRKENQPAPRSGYPQMRWEGEGGPPAPEDDAKLANEEKAQSREAKPDEKTVTDRSKKGDCGCPH
ncbi:MAG: hypothetical protein JNM12_02020 [Alphaproteobacteria bacterium]|nr:hypothetical protein [Alphaproteobacteria bacterium]